MITLAELEQRDLLEPFKAIAKRHGMVVGELFSRSRFHHLCEARFECWCFLREHGWSFPAIGKLFGRDHTTIMAGVDKRYERLCKEALTELARAEVQSKGRAA